MTACARSTGRQRSRRRTPAVASKRRWPPPGGVGALAATGAGRFVTATGWSRGSRVSDRGFPIGAGILARAYCVCFETGSGEGGGDGRGALGGLPRSGRKWRRRAGCVTRPRRNPCRLVIRRPVIYALLSVAGCGGRRVSRPPAIVYSAIPHPPQPLSVRAQDAARRDAFLLVGGGIAAYGLERCGSTACRTGGARGADPRGGVRTPLSWGASEDRCSPLFSLTRRA